MFRIVYDKKDNKVVGIHSLSKWTETKYFLTETDGNNEKYEREIPESEVVNHEASKIRVERKEKHTSVFYDKSKYEHIDFETIPEITKNQYLVYENGSLVVKTNIQNYEQLVEKYIRERYSVSNELAILRQKETKPIEYQAYFEYCEQCKSKAKAETGE